MPKIYVPRRIELEIACGVRVGQRRKFAGSMWKKPEVLDRKSGADKWFESASNTNYIPDPRSAQLTGWVVRYDYGSA